MSSHDLLEKAKASLAKGDGQSAISSLAELLRSHPKHAEALYLMAMCADIGGQREESIRLLSAAYDADPQSPTIAYALGAQLAPYDPDRAYETLQQSVEMVPENAAAWTAMGNILRSKGWLGKASQHYRTALEIDASLVEVETNLGALLHDQFDHEEALKRHERALSKKPTLTIANSNRLFGMHYADHLDAEQIYKAHIEWATRVEAADEPGVFRSQHVMDWTENRRLRVGYVSPDLRMHPVGWFFHTLLEHHNADHVETFCYALVQHADPHADAIRAACDQWVDVSALGDDALDDRIRGDKIDILVDLAGHTGGNRIHLFARKPAPIQVSWLGYPDTTGLAAMDYRLTDSVADPADSLASEKLIRLDGGFLCYSPPVDIAVDKNVRTDNPVTFGSFNNLAKLNRSVIACWARILMAVPTSRLILKARSLADPDTRSRCIDLFVAHGVAASRLDLRGRTDHLKDSFEMYNEVDVALDPFPYNGTTTTFDALWMGTPVITLNGDRHAGRVGASILTHVGRSDEIAETIEDYVAIAQALAENCALRRQLAASLRSDVQSSPVMDPAGFADKVEGAYREMWRQLCETHAV